MDDENQKVGLRIPFSAYDIFGYVIPGVNLLLCILLFEYLFQHEFLSQNVSINTPLLTLINLTFNDNFKNTWFLGIIYLAMVLNIAYVTGHIISSASSFLIDRILIFKGYGYPFETLYTAPH